MTENSIERRTTEATPVYTQQPLPGHAPRQAPRPYPYAEPAPHPAPRAPGRTDGLSIAAFVCGLCGLAIIPIVLGHISFRRFRRDGLGGTGFAVVGLILGYGWLAVWIITAIAIAGSVIWAVNV